MSEAGPRGLSAELGFAAPVSARGAFAALAFPRVPLLPRALR